MKINNKVYGSLLSEPIEVQNINNKKVEIHYMNDTPYLSQYVSRGRFYLWTSNDKDYKLLVEKGFYEKMGYFFDQKINGIWINFLEEVGAINKKISRLFLGISLITVIIIVTIMMLFFQEQMMMGVIGALFVTIVVNMIQSAKINKIVREKNLKAQAEIRAVLTEEGFNKFIADQDAYVKEYFKFEEDEEIEENIDQIEEIAEEVQDAEIVEIEDKQDEAKENEE